MAVVDCIELSNPPDALSLEVPQFGVLESVRQSFYDLPDPSTYLMQFFGSTQLALAPLRRFLDMLEILLAIQECINSVVDAVATLSPKPIIDSLAGLVKALGRITTLFPPLSYIPPMIDLTRLVITVIDQLLDFFEFVDGRISALKASLDYAIELGDTDLAAIVDCATDDLNKQMVSNFDILRGIVPLLQLLMTPITRLIQNPALRKALEPILGAGDDLIAGVEDVSDQILSDAGVPVLDTLLTPLVVMRNSVAQLHNIVAPIVGRAPNLTTRSLPDYDNL